MNRVSNPIVATFSIVGHDPETGELGVAVQSKFLGSGSVVPWAKADVGAVATQSLANPSYGPEGLQLLEEGYTPEEVVRKLTEDDSERELRQVGIVDAKGEAATFTGENCYEWAGGQTGPHYAVQGNILVSEETVKEMATTFEKADGSLADRLLQSLQAGQMAGGDKRGKQSAALLVVKKNGGYGGFNDRFIDLRVDEHDEPIHELVRIYHLQQLYFGATKEENVVSIEGEVKEELLKQLKRLGYLPTVYVVDSIMYKAFTSFLHRENFEERALEHGKLDLEVLEFMKQKQL
ncbi:MULTISPECIES: DUF1028 domain-containing protein [Pontibacillus]|uniref:DUF1028 domain-containing protein n=1 Tax=Pontibacillus chungwhensis TaxID=265426 RepID=A0ABY8V511_9BACI|nr:MULTISPECIES: DUF1028 domain-containing protein [Pontibacillus]MCD5322383.1 DUF1028 domain-containing protein [Pontibacillus sp. HN14]WIF99670.1 DUF1028 domain-containing protein [Pontibacillus chungwhensis]